MHVAATSDNVDLLNMLIDAGGDVNVADVVSLYTCTIHVTGYLRPFHTRPKNRIQNA